MFGRLLRCAFNYLNEASYGETQVNTLELKMNTIKFFMHVMHFL